MNPAHQSSKLPTRLLPVAMAWSCLWLLVQLALLLSAHFDTLSLTFNRQPWSDDLQGSQAAFPLAQFFLCALALHACFAGANAAAFRSLLMPRLPATAHRTAFLAQLSAMTLALHLANAWFYPYSVTGNLLALALVQPSGQVIAVLLCAACAIYLACWLLSASARLLRSYSALFVGTAVTLSALSFVQTTPRGAHPVAPREQPDVIVIGVDSLRPDHLVRFGAPKSYMPHIDRMLDDSLIFEDTLSTQPHTFPATVSILTGRWPTNNGARGNLFPRELIESNHSIAHRFSDAGYRTVLALDETRFANIDASYGFQELLGPEIGIGDFMMSFVADNALTNLTANTSVGRLIFPNIHGNRVLDYVYSPDSFNDRLESSIGTSDDRPLFLYAHFCAAHWPYRLAPPYEEDRHRYPDASDYSDSKGPYLRGLEQVDGQFARLMIDLEESGRLRNAVVVLLSDHGEDFAMKKDAVVNAQGQLSTQFIRGHGGSAIRAPQVRTLLAFRTYGMQPTLASETRSTPASLVDISPTIAGLASLGNQGTRYDGIDLLAKDQGSDKSAARFRYVESSYFPDSLNRQNIVPSEVVSETAGMYSFTPSGRMEIRRNRIDEQITFRQRAVYQGDWIVATLESPGTKPIVVNRRMAEWWTLQDAPAHAPTAEMLGALCSHWSADPSVEATCGFMGSRHSSSAHSASPRTRHVTATGISGASNNLSPPPARRLR
jgi:hypothetical protein